MSHFSKRLIISFFFIATVFTSVNAHADDTYTKGAVAYYNGDYAKAEKHMMKSAKRGGILAQNRLGEEFLSGEHFEKDPAKSLYWYTKAADQGNPEAQYNIGLIYLSGAGVEASGSTAVLWLKKAAVQKYSPAQYKLGIIYEKGQGVEQVYYKAETWFRRAHRSGSMDAAFHLGVLHRDGLLTNDDQNLSNARAVKWFQRAQKGGHQRAGKEIRALNTKIANNNVSAHSEAAQANPSASPSALVELGKDALKGDNRDLAIKYWKEAAAQGSGEADYRLGIVFSGKAEMRRYESAARKGYIPAQTRLGYLYKTGRSVEQSYERSRHWYRMAADLGDRKSQYEVGKMYQTGQGVGLSHETAILWYRKAAAQNHKYAVRDLRLLTFDPNERYRVLHPFSAVVAVFKAKGITGYNDE